MIDAKHWNFQSNSNTTRIVESGDEQFKRAIALAESKKILADLLSELGLEWTKAVLLPMVVTLLSPPIQNFYIPIVSILSFNSFINEFEDNMDFFKKVYVSEIPIQKKLL